MCCLDCAAIFCSAVWAKAALVRSATVEITVRTRNLRTTFTRNCMSLSFLLAVEPEPSRALVMNYGTRLAAGGVQLPSRIDGGVLIGQYKRMTKTNLPFGAGSQLASFALPGDSAWRYISTEPSGLVMNLLRWLNS